MINLHFQRANEVILIVINGNNVLFGSTIFGAALADISGLKLDFHGTIREFPDLKEDLQWREKAIERFKKHIKALNDEDKISDYIICELRNKGYIPKLKQKQGFRPVRIK